MVIPAGNMISAGMVEFPSWEVCQLVKFNKIGWLAALLPDLSWLGCQLGRITDFYFPVGPFLHYFKVLEHMQS
jgi:hypothetical protein